MKIIILLSLVLSALKSSSQTYYAKYQVSSTNGFVEKIGIPGELKAIYHVWANNDYIEVIGTDPEIKILATSQLKEHSSNERVIMSYKDSLCYFVNEKKYVKIKYYPAEVLKKKWHKRGYLNITTKSYDNSCIIFTDFVPARLSNAEKHINAIMANVLKRNFFINIIFLNVVRR